MVSLFTSSYSVFFMKNLMAFELFKTSEVSLTRGVSEVFLRY
jgi:hypothetical protein